MNTVKVESRPVSVASGQVRLTAAQAGVRAHALRIVGKADKNGTAVYDVTGPIQFKVGETFEFSGELAKSGSLRDREAEELAKLDAVDKAVAQVRAQYEAQLETQRGTIQAEFEKRLEAAIKELSDSLEPAVMERVRVGLKALAK